jgi:hypothetical protein B2_04755
MLIVLLGCEEVNKQSKGNFITVNVTANYPKKELVLQDFLDVEYISLETTEEFLTSASIQAITKDFLLFKEDNRHFSGKISFFDRQGKGLRTFDRKGQSGKEYINALRVVLDEENKEIFVNSHLSKKVLVYDWMGNFKRSFNQKENCYYDQIENFDGDHLICHDGSFSLSNPGKKRNSFMLVSKQDGNITEISIPYKDNERKLTVMVQKTDQGNLISSIFNKPLIPYEDSWLLMEPSSDTIYRYTQDQMMQPFIVRTPSIQSMETEIFLFPGILTDRYYFMQTVRKEYDFATDKGFPTKELVYDKQENTIFECTIYNNDFKDKKPISLVYEIPIPPVIVNKNEIAFTKRLEAPELVEAYKQGQLKGKLKEIAAELDEESNPVIMLAKYKK